MRHRRSGIRRRKRMAEEEHHINEVIDKNQKGSYVRFQNNLGQVIVADHKVRDMDEQKERIHYEFAVDKKSFDNFDDAEAYRLEQVQACKDRNDPPTFCLALELSKPAKTQIDYDSRLVMKTFRDKAIGMITNHVKSKNPKMTDGDDRTDQQNQPFFMYLSWRAPHRPMSHDWEFDPNDPHDHMPYVSFSKAGEQLGIFDEYMGDVMKTLTDLDVADNTLVIFTSDNGPDQGGYLHLTNKFGHMRMGTMRGKKASVYEGGHRVPFLSWWPKGIHPALHGTNYDLPVSQTDLFATYADILDYPLPGGDKCIYAYNSANAGTHGRDPSMLGRRVVSNCIENGVIVTTTRAPSTTSPATTSTSVAPTSAVTSAMTTLLPPTTSTLPPTTSTSASDDDDDVDLGEDGPGSTWASSNPNLCLGKAFAGDDICNWKTCEQCEEFWTNELGSRTSKRWLPNRKKKFCKTNEKCFENRPGLARALPSCQYTASPVGSYPTEIRRHGYSAVERFMTQEDRTGFLLGWEGCMAEDSHSFKEAFGASVVEETDTHEKFESNMKTVESKIFAGKLGDLTLRLGRYKLIRFNAPKGKTLDSHQNNWVGVSLVPQSRTNTIGGLN